jgi:phosphatidylserine/phosphatidylglycerophosphate/cardiolipin synthase-like enzyme
MSAPAIIKAPYQWLQITTAFAILKLIREVTVPALAFANNDIALIAWTYDRHLPGCLGFAVWRLDLNAGTEEALPALARFKNVAANVPQSTVQAPIQKYWWKDLHARRGGHFRYRIEPMGGAPGNLKRLEGVEPLVSNAVTISADRGRFKAFFNRGIVASQSVVDSLGTPSAARLLRHVEDPTDPIRSNLAGELPQALMALLDRADTEGGEIRGALYELDDPKGLEVRLQAKHHGDPALRVIVLGNERTSTGKGADRVVVEDADAENRANLKTAGVSVADRILPDQHIPHNKFLVLKKQGAPVAVLTGSTNWTKTGLATQTNNALLIESPAVAAIYADYWDQLEKDTDSANRGVGDWQSKAFRDWNRAHNAEVLAKPIALEDDSAKVTVLFSPNTESTLKSPPKEKPADMQRVFELVTGARQAVLFLAFDPGNNSILDAAGAALAENSKLFVRGALTSPQRAENFKDALEKASQPAPANATPTVGVIGEPAKDAPQGVPDYRAIPAGKVTADDRFGAWEAELGQVGHAIIHDKIVVIDPFSDDCAVILGSHNLGYRASHNNDENMVIVQGHRPLAEAYACHVLDIYDHYAWRYWLARFPGRFGKPLEGNDKWQERYIDGAEEKSPELRFWLSATPSTADG